MILGGEGCRPVKPRLDLHMDLLSHPTLFDTDFTEGPLLVRYCVEIVTRRNVDSQALGLKETKTQ